MFFFRWYSQTIVFITHIVYIIDAFKYRVFTPHFRVISRIAGAVFVKITMVGVTEIRVFVFCFNPCVKVVNMF